MTSQREIARLAKTSLKTVSRVINRDPLVNEKTRARIEEIINKLGYEPSQAARMMRSQHSNIIGFLADRVTTTSSSIDLVRGAQDVAWEHGKQMMLFNIEPGTPSAAMANSQLAAFRAEAIIYATVFHREITPPVSNVPLILLNCFDAEAKHTAVLPDDFRLAHDLTRHILAKGYKRPAFLNLERDIVATHLRAKGFIAAAAERGMNVSDRVFSGVLSAGDEPKRYGTREVLKSLFSQPEPPDLLICGQDLMALNVYFELAELGVRVGKDVGVASFDNQEPIVSLMRPGLSTMELPYYDMGRAAMTLAIDGAQPGQSHILKGNFIERQSF